MKRVITAVDSEGRSYIESCVELTDARVVRLFDFMPNPVLSSWIGDLDPQSTARWIGPPGEGGARWVLADVGPHGYDDTGPLENVDEYGFHVTNTIDFVFVLKGPLTLLLDRESVILEAGDVVVQQATRHAWRNGDQGSSFLALLLWPITA